MQYSANFISLQGVKESKLYVSNQEAINFLFSRIDMFNGYKLAEVVNENNDIIVSFRTIK
jgi:hypothetical protein